MHKQKFLLLFIGFFPFILNGQYVDFDLSKYKLPDIRINRLDATFNFKNDVDSYLSHEP